LRKELAVSKFETVTVVCGICGGQIETDKKLLIGTKAGTLGHEFRWKGKDFETTIVCTQTVTHVRGVLRKSLSRRGRILRKN
jgi:hypothetical protein